jgi:hypothetical protein
MLQSASRPLYIFLLDLKTKHGSPCLLIDYNLVFLRGPSASFEFGLQMVAVALSALLSRSAAIELHRDCRPVTSILHHHEIRQLKKLESIRIK